MKSIHGAKVYDEKSLCKVCLTNPYVNLDNTIVDFVPNFPPELDIEIPPNLITQVHRDSWNRTEFDRKMQSLWFMPNEYKEMDIAKYVLDLCKTDAELQRVGEELILYLEKDLFDMLRYLKYLVDIMRENGIVWGVGRGSSVSSYVLYLLGIHRIDSIYYDLDIRDFLRD